MTGREGRVDERGYEYRAIIKRTDLASAQARYNHDGAFCFLANDQREAHEIANRACPKGYTVIEVSSVL